MNEIDAAPSSEELERLAQRLHVLEAKDEIRGLMAAYVHARDFREGSVSECFTADAVWEGLGPLAETLGVHEGREAIAERFAGQIPPALHLLANESITVDGEQAVGDWTYLQPMVLAGRAMWVAAQYHNDFQREQGRWRIRHVRIEGIFQVPYEEGWAEAAFFAR